jgi:hypothetical protein
MEEEGGTETLTRDREKTHTKRERERPGLPSASKGRLVRTTPERGSQERVLRSNRAKLNEIFA